MTTEDICDPVLDWLRKAAEVLAENPEGWGQNRRLWKRDYWTGYCFRGGTTTPEDTTGTVSPSYYLVHDRQDTTALEYYRYHPDRIRWYDRHYLRHIAVGVLRLGVHTVRLRRWRQSAGPRPKPSDEEVSGGP